jgi:hypothetical protein
MAVGWEINNQEGSMKWNGVDLQSTGQNDGYAGLDSQGKVPSGQINGSTISGITSARKIASGITNLIAGQETVLGTFMRNAGEVVQIFVFVQQNVNQLEFGASIDKSASDQISVHFHRSANNNEFSAVAFNGNNQAARDLEWVIIGVTP